MTKNKFTRRLLSMIMIAIVTTTTFVTVYATSEENNLNELVGEVVASDSNPLPLHSVKDSINVNGNMIALFSTFDNSIEAMTNVKIRLQNFLNKVRITYGLSELNDLNWETYAMNSRQYVEDTASISNEDESNARYFARFIDIYENTLYNEQIISFSENQDVTRSNNQEYLRELASMLPYTSNLFIEHAGFSTQTRSAFNIDNGITYANTYGENQNGYLNYYYFSNGDCANFASQILEAGGVSQISSDSIYNGWWHTLSWGVHEHSQSWSMARNFGFYQGIYAITSNFNTFSGSLQRGDFIGVDWDGDGDMDHIGFVTGIGTYGTYSGKYYRDFIVAQHTSNYVRWVSDAENGWENSDGNATYARLRRS